MIAHFVICTLGSADLLALALASIDKFAGESTVDLIELPEEAVGDRNAHGRALDQWKNEEAREAISDDDVVVIMDPDVAILSAQWRVEMEAAFRGSRVGIWGAGCREDFGLRVHPSMMAIRGTVFNTLTSTFRPFARPSDTEWRDTGGWYCKCARDKGWRLQKEERALGWDWHGAAAWYPYQYHPGRLRTMWDRKIPFPMPLWAHLGGGTWSDPARLTRWQRLRRRRAIAQRREFIQAVTEVLNAP